MYCCFNMVSKTSKMEFSSFVAKPYRAIENSFVFKTKYQGSFFQMAKWAYDFYSSCVTNCYRSAFV